MPTIHSEPDLAASGAFFAEQGYYVARGLFADRISELEGEFDAIVQQLASSGEPLNARWGGEASDRLNGAGRTVLHTHQVHMYSATWLRLWLDAGFLDHAERFLGPDIILHHTKLFQKPAERGAAFPMHQDWPYFPVIGDRCIAAIVHVSAATTDMGCFRLYPGSHRDGRWDDSAGRGGISTLQRKYPLEGALALEAEPGDVVFFHCLTVHGSDVNRHPARVRKTVLAQLYAGDTELEHRGAPHPNARLVLRGRNRRMTRSQANA
jgi:hypothetical protein